MSTGITPRAYSVWECRNLHRQQFAALPEDYIVYCTAAMIDPGSDRYDRLCGLRMTRTQLVEITL